MEDNLRFVFLNKNGRYNTFDENGKVLFIHNTSKIEPEGSIFLVSGVVVKKEMENYAFFDGEKKEMSLPAFKELYGIPIVYDWLKLYGNYNNSLHCYKTDNMYIMTDGSTNTVITKVDGSIYYHSFYKFDTDRKTRRYNTSGYYAIFDQEKIDIIQTVFVMWSRMDTMEKGDPSELDIAITGYRLKDSLWMNTNKSLSIKYYKSCILCQRHGSYYYIDSDGSIALDAYGMSIIEDELADTAVDYDYYESVMKRYYDKGFVHGTFNRTGYVYLKQIYNTEIYAFPIEHYNTIIADGEVYEKEFKYISENRAMLDKKIAIEARKSGSNLKRLQYYNLYKLPKNKEEKK